jgi:hypothetical protein
MPSNRCFAVLPLLGLIACDSPSAPTARELRAPAHRADAGVVKTKSNAVFDTDASAQNTCNGDFVTLEGKGHQVFTTIDDGGTLYITVHFNYADVKGYGFPSGARYHLNATQKEKAIVVQFPEFIFEDNIQLNSELVSEGSEPNLILHLTETVSIVNNEVTVISTRYSLECRG